MADRGFVVHAFERAREGHAEVDLVGRLANGETFAAVERRWRPFFAIRSVEIARARPVLSEQSGLDVVEWDRRTMDGSETLRVETQSSASARTARDALHAAGVRTYEADVKLASQLLMERGIHGSVELGGDSRPGRRVSRVYQDPELAPAAASPDPRLSVLSLDIETDRQARAVYAVGLAFRALDGAVSSEVLFCGAPAAGARCFPGEREMLAELRGRILELDPDIVTGWNVVDFDFRTLHRRFGELGVRFDVGRSDSPAVFLDRSGGDGGVRYRRSRAIIEGRQVVDALWLVRLANLGLEDYRLETVSQALLGRGKLLDRESGESGVEAIERLYREDPAALCAYCVEDARLVLDILGSEGFLDVAVQKALLIGTPLDQTHASVAGFELLYMEHLHRRGIVAPTLGVDQEPVGTSPGGGIITSRAGIYDGVLAFDYKSLYPSIMRTFNIDPLTRVPRELAEHAPEGAALIRAPNGAFFRREPGILPEILARFFASRAEARSHGNERSAYAYKIVMNSFYGVLGTGGCRFASPDLAGAITTFGQEFLFWTRDLVTAQGYEVIYGDTDSIFVRSGLPRGTPVARLEALGRELCALVNARVTERVRDGWGLESRLELEFEAVYLRFFMPPMRTPVAAPAEEGEEGESRGRAKGYAGLLADRDGERLEIKGMEAVRHDWTELAHQMQRDLLDWVFHDVSAEEITARVRSVVGRLRSGELDGSLVYRRALRKPVEAYTRSQPPHAKAALLLAPEERSGVIRYVWTTEGPQPETRRTAPPDYDHYVEKQLEPIVQTVAPYAGLDSRLIFERDRQLDLFG
jgi:DNA polymerase II